MYELYIAIVLSYINLIVTVNCCELYKIIKKLIIFAESEYYGQQILVVWC
jgi:hypothetical protein